MRSEAGRENIRIAIIGAGMAGMLSAIRLKESGYKNITVFEKADRVGGTWRENTYPGLTCDVPSHAYTYSFEPNPDWSHIMPPGAEIQSYFEMVSRKYGILPLIEFNQEIVSCVYNDGVWQLETKRGQKAAAEIVIAATGVLHVPRYPDIPGVDSFKGALFHTSRWDHDVPLDDQRVGVIGTGSTGVQIVSALCKRASKLLHFQRTPQWIMPIENRPFTEAEKNAFRSDRALLKHMQNEPEYLANVERFTNAIVNPESPEMAEIEAVVLQNLESSVSDPALCEQLRPNYRAACKRLIFSPDFYEAVQQPAVSVITERISAIEEKGVRTADGTLHELDVIALATGFHADRFMRPMNIVGRGGIALNDFWADRPRAHLAISMPDFPNFFMLNGPNGPVGNFSLIDIAEQQWHYIEQLIDLIASGDCREICVKQQAFEAFDELRIEAAKKTIFGSGCQSWYLDDKGVPATWPWTQKRFVEEMAQPKLEDYELN